MVIRALILVAALASAALAAGVPAPTAEKPVLATREPAPVTEITVQRVGGLGPGAPERTVFRADGTASFSGSRGGERSGEYRAMLPVKEWKRLSGLLSEKGFWDLQEHYRQGENQVPPRFVLDAPGIMITAVRGGKRKSVAVFGQAGPPALRELQTALLDAGKKLSWEKAPVTAP